MTYLSHATLKSWNSCVCVSAFVQHISIRYRHILPDLHYVHVWRHLLIHFKWSIFTGSLSSFSEITASTLLGSLYTRCWTTCEDLIAYSHKSIIKVMLGNQLRVTTVQLVYKLLDGVPSFHSSTVHCRVGFKHPSPTHGTRQGGLSATAEWTISVRKVMLFYGY